MSRKRILLVEDDPDITGSMAPLLEDAGHSVVGVVDNCADAILLAGREVPDVAIVDIQLRGDLDGVTTGRELAALGAEVIFVTAYLDVAANEARHFARAILQKPVPVDDLLGAVEREDARTPHGD